MASLLFLMILRTNILTFLFLFFCVLHFTNAQEFRPVKKHITIADGLPDNEIYQIVEDNKKNIWLATNSGLYLFNGSDYILKKAKKQKGKAVFGLTVDTQNKIWFTNLAGQIIRCNSNECNIIDETVEPNQTIPLLTKTENGILIVSRDFIKHIDFNGKIIAKEIKNSTFPISNAIKIDNNKYAIYHSEKLYYWQNNQLIEKAKFAKQTNLLGTSTLTYVNEKLILTNLTKQGINQFEITENEKIQRNFFPEIKKLRNNSIKTDENNIWITTNKGVFHYEIKDGNINFKKQYLSDKITTSYLQDFNGNIWITTIDDGIYILPKQGISSLVITNKAFFSVDDIEPQNDDLVTAIINKNELHNIATNTKKNKKITIERLVEQSLNYNATTNKLWVHSGKFLKLDAKTLQTQKTKNIAGVKQLSSKGEFLYSSFFRSFEKLDNDLNTVLFNNKRSSSFAITKNGQFAVVQFVDGINILNTDDFSIEKTKSSILEKAISSNIVPNLSAENEVYAIISINDKKQLFSLSKDDNWQPKNQNIVLKNGEVIIPNSIIADEEFLYVATKNGLFYKKHNKKDYRHFDADFFIDWKAVNNIKLTKKTIWLQTKKTIYKLEKEVLKEKYTIPQISFKSTEYQSDKILLQSTKNELQFKINTIGYTSLSSYQPQFSFDNLNWKSPIFDENTVYINNIPKGNNKLFLRFYNPYKNVSTITQQFSVYKQTSYYNTWWFYVLLILLTIITISFLWHLRTNFIKKQLQEKINKASLQNEITTLKLENLRSQMNPHFVFNALNSVQDYIIANNANLASTYLVKFSRLIRIYLNHSRLSHITLQQEIDALELYIYLEKNRLDGSFMANINIDKNIDINQVLVPSLFLQPYVENAINHGLYQKESTDKKLDINFKKEKNNLLVEIIDNGIGRTASRLLDKKHEESFSIMANDKRIELLNTYYIHKIEVTFTDLVDKNNYPKGTKVALKIPIQV